jgi:hypothetical protein
MTNTATALRQELHAAIDTMPEKSLAALRPLFSVLAGPLYTIETDLTDEEKEIIAAGEQKYRESPESFVPLESIMAGTK